MQREAEFGTDVYQQSVSIKMHRREAVGIDWPVLGIRKIMNAAGRGNSQSPGNCYIVHVFLLIGWTTDSALRPM